MCLSDFVIQLTDNLDYLSDVQVAEKKLFLVQGRKPQLMNWEQFGLRIGIEEDSLSSYETVEVATAALVGGQFKFPKNTVLVSAVYAVSISEPLLKPLRLEVQHCVDLRGRPDLSQYLKFAIAPVSTPSLPYQFSLVEGGEFTSNSWYGAINRKDFCLVCILGLIMVTTIIGGGGGGQQVQQLQAGGGGGQDQGGQAQQHQQQGVHQQQPLQEQHQQLEEGQGQSGGEGEGGGSQSSQGQELIQQEHHQLQVVQVHQQGGPAAQDHQQGGPGAQDQRQGGVQEHEGRGEEEQQPQGSGGEDQEQQGQQHVREGQEHQEKAGGVPGKQKQGVKELPADEIKIIKKEDHEEQLPQGATPITTG